MTDEQWAFIQNLLHEFGDDPETAMLIYGCAPVGAWGDAIRSDLSGWLIGYTGLDEAIDLDAIDLGADQ